MNNYVLGIGINGGIGASATIIDFNLNLGSTNKELRQWHD
jgi:hypothetical protein